MKKRMKLVLSFLLITAFVNAQTICINAGQSLFPGTYANIRYEHYTNSDINVAGGLFLESSNKHNLRYRCYGMDLLAQYASSRDNENTFVFKGSVGATLQIENEPWVYKDWPLAKRLNYGLLAECAGQVNLSDAFGVSLFAQQKIFFNKLLSATHFIFGLGLSYRLSQ